MVRLDAYSLGSEGPHPVVEKQQEVVGERACQSRYDAADQYREVDKAGQNNDPAHDSRKSQRKKDL